MSTTDIEPAGLVVDRGASITATIDRWENDIERCFRLAHRIVRTEIVPESYWPLPPGKKRDDMPMRNPRRKHRDETIEDYRERLEIATATAGGTIYSGAQLGLPSWNVALQNIDYVHGRQSMRSRLLESLYISAGHRFELIQKSATRACARFQRAGTDRWDEMEFTFERAVTEGLVKGQGPNTNNSRGSDQYLLRPTTMLWWRLMSDAVSTLTPEVMLGMAVVEEQEALEGSGDIVATASDLPREPDGPARTVAAALAARASSSPAGKTGPAALTADSGLPSAADVVEMYQAAIDERPPEKVPVSASRPAAEPATVPVAASPASPQAPSPDPDVDRALDDLATPRPEPFGNKGWAALQTRLTEIGVVRPSERRRVISAVVGREIQTVRDLTMADGQFVLDNLAGQAGQRLCADVLQRPSLLGVPVSPAEDGKESSVEQTMPSEPDQSDVPDPDGGIDPWRTGGTQ